jgi:GNAT superfamily N-acetyltransferase
MGRALSPSGSARPLGAGWYRALVRPNRGIQVPAKPWPSPRRDSGPVATAPYPGPVTPLMLVRQAVPAWEQDVGELLNEVPGGTLDVGQLIRDHRVLVLSDLTLPPTAAPVAAAAFRVRPVVSTAQLAGIGVIWHLRRRGIGRRLLTGSLTWLRADGFERVHAWAPEGGGGALLLASAGFVDDRLARADGYRHFVSVL